jgi:hypothetical protein
VSLICSVEHQNENQQYENDQEKSIGRRAPKMC